MVSMLSLAQVTGSLGFGMQSLVSVWQVHLKGTDPVTSVVYSPDGIITSVAYSPDGTHVVSGSNDNIVRVWNVITGQCVAGPCAGHTSDVTSVYSPDGTHIVSGSYDITIRIWNATTGQCVGDPFQGQTCCLWLI